MIIVKELGNMKHIADGIGTKLTGIRVRGRLYW